MDCQRYPQWCVPRRTAGPVVRAIAQGRQIPLIDFQKELLAIPDPHGLSPDGTHPKCENYNTCCWFDAQSLGAYGYNIRNLITLQSLDRMKRLYSGDRRWSF